jgi:hypothetical protein
VVTKKEDPYEESAIENEASKYSMPCKKEKYIPKIIVIRID